MKILIYTLGCAKNFNGSQVAAGILEEAGHSVILANDELSDLSAEEAMAYQNDIDAIMVNTCGFIEDAKTESIEAIFDMARYGKMLIVSGCLSQRYGEELYKEIPEVDMFVGVNEYERLPEILKEHDKARTLIKTDHEHLMDVEARKLPDRPYSATLKISEGCDNYCTFCAIPGIRGPYRSRPKESVLAEAKRLAEQGVKELILIAEDTTTYGLDLYGKLSLSDLLNDLCEIEGIEWIRILYCYEDRITDELIETIATQEKICDYLDIPIQHISDPVLKAMNRRSTTESIYGRLEALRKRIPDIHIRTTLIVGFPGETEEQFGELVDFVETARFERLGAFRYSPEDGTPAAEMPDQISEEEKERRLDIIMTHQMGISLAANEAKIGKTLEVMVDGREEDGSYVGRTRYDAPGIDDGVIFTSDKELFPGDIVKVAITDAFDYDLVGEAV